MQPIDHRAASLPRRLEVGSIVLTRLPADAAALAARLPAGTSRCSSVWARSRRNVCIVARQVRIDGVPTAAALPADRLGRPLPSWQHCRPLAEGELFLLSVTNPASFDSRYFGPVSASAVIGVAHPVRLEHAHDGRRFAARCRASHRAIGHAVPAAAAVSSRVQRGRSRAALRATSGAAVHRAGVLPRTRPTCGPSASICAFAGGLAASSTAPPGRRRPERQRRAKARQRTRHRAASPVCTWGWRGTGGFATVPRGTRGTRQCSMSACFARQDTP